jgi:hypothetical protein
MEENERLAKHTSQLTLDNHALRQQLPHLPLPDGKHRLSTQVSLHKFFDLRNNFARRIIKPIDPIFSEP